LSSFDPGLFTASLPCLRELDLTGNRLSLVKRNVFKSIGASLRTLLLSQNRIEMIESGGFDGLSRLKSLCLRGNRLSVPIDVAVVFNRLDSLEELRLNENGNDTTSYELTEFIAHMPKLKFLALGSSGQNVLI
jgi:hypothetical protein